MPFKERTYILNDTDADVTENSKISCSNKKLLMSRWRKYLQPDLRKSQNKLKSHAILTKLLDDNMDYLRMDGKQYASKVRNKALKNFDWLSQWLE